MNDKDQYTDAEAIAAGDCPSRYATPYGVVHCDRGKPHTGTDDVITWLHPQTHRGGHSFWSDFMQLPAIK